MCIKHISDSPMVSFGASTFKIFVNYLEVMINKADNYEKHGILILS